MGAGCGCAGWVGDSRGGVTSRGVTRRGGCVSWDTVGWPGCSPLALGGQGGCAPTLLSLASDLCFTLSLQTPSVWQQQFNARLIVAGPRCAGRQWGPPHPRHAGLVTAVRAPASPRDAAQLLQESPTWLCLCREGMKQHGGLHPTLAHWHRWLCRTKRRERGFGDLG